jgi:adenosylhomocysteine nucleosidase
MVGTSRLLGLWVLGIHSDFWFRVSGFDLPCGRALGRVEFPALQLPKVIIFTALQIEGAAVRRALSDKDHRFADIHTVGILARHLPRSLEKGNAVALVMAGLAGALDPALGVGDVVIDDPQGLAGPLSEYRHGGIWSADRIVATPAEKAEIFSRTGALAVEMEGARARECAERLGIPYIAVRAISDSAGETLDPSVVGFVDDFGGVRPMRLAAGVLRRPGLIPYLNRLGKNSRIAADRLGIAVRKIVDALVDS